MSKKGPFEAAIEVLRPYEKLVSVGGKLEASVRVTIKVLEAAGKVDKDNALWNLDEAFSQGRGHVEMMAPYRNDHNVENYDRADKEIGALLESLPEKED